MSTCPVRDFNPATTQALAHQASVDTWCVVSFFPSYLPNVPCSPFVNVSRRERTTNQWQSLWFELTLDEHTFPMWSTPAAGACSDHLILPYRPRGVHAQASLMVLIAPSFGPSFDLPVGYGDVYEVRMRLRCVRKERSLGQAGQEGV